MNSSCMDTSRQRTLIFLHHKGLKRMSFVPLPILSLSLGFPPLSMCISLPRVVPPSTLPVNEKATKKRRKKKRKGEVPIDYISKLG